MTSRRPPGGAERPPPRRSEVAGASVSVVVTTLQTRDGALGSAVVSGQCAVLPPYSVKLDGGAPHPLGGRRAGRRRLSPVEAGARSPGAAASRGGPASPAAGPPTGGWTGFPSRPPGVPSPARPDC